MGMSAFEHFELRSGFPFPHNLDIRYTGPVSTNVVSKKCKSVSDNADCYYGK